MAYKVYSTNYLMKLTKAEIIDILRTAEHNYIATEEALTRSADYGKGLLKEIEQLKKADVQSVKRGHWIEIAGYGGWSETYYQCPECNTTEYIPSNFCPNCGADLREIDNG